MARRSERANSKVVINSEVIHMYQIYSLVSIVVLLWGITIWASLPEEEKDSRS